jgi:hypothetical protein
MHKMPKDCKNRDAPLVVLTQQKSDLNSKKNKKDTRKKTGPFGLVPLASDRKTRK